MKDLTDIIKYLDDLEQWLEAYKEWYAKWKAKNTVQAFDDTGSNPDTPPPPPPGH